MNQPPSGLPIYLVLTDPDDAAFCHKSPPRWKWVTAFMAHRRLRSMARM